MFLVVEETVSGFGDDWDCRYEAGEEELRYVRCG